MPVCPLGLRHRGISPLILPYSTGQPYASCRRGGGRAWRNNSISHGTFSACGACKEVRVLEVHNLVHPRHGAPEKWRLRNGSWALLRRAGCLVDIALYRHGFTARGRGIAMLVLRNSSGSLICVQRAERGWMRHARSAYSTQTTHMSMRIR